MIYRYIYIILILLVIPTSSFSKERDYQKKWCDSMSGKMEVVLSDKSRVDCVTTEYAVEVEFAHKWQEAIGQSLYYSIVLDKLPGIVIITDDDSNKYIDRLNIVADIYNIKVWIMKSKEE